MVTPPPTTSTTYFDIDEEGDVIVLKFREAVITDGGGISIMERELLEMTEGKNKIVLDFSNVDGMTSAVFRGVVKLVSRLEKTGGKMCFCAIKESISHLFSIVRLKVEITANRAAALQGM